MRRVSAALWTACSILMLSVSASGAATEKVVYSFCSQENCADGTNPVAGLLRIKDELYATTSNLYFYLDGGTVDSINMGTGATTVLYSFGGADYAPRAAPIDINGKLYVTTTESAYVGDDGAIYSLTLKKGKETTLYTFCSQSNCADGAWPSSRLLNANGLIYGTTSSGGSNVEGCNRTPGCGTVFSFDAATGAENVVHSFCTLQSCSDGDWPAGDLVDVDGILYGTTAFGGSGSGCNDMGLGCGTVFALDPNTGVETVLHTFAGESQDGGVPLAGLIDVNGTLYGTTEYGGGRAYCAGYPDGAGCGTVFSINLATGAEAVIYAFKNNGKDGLYPFAGLMEMKGKLYGTTEAGGAAGYGTVFSIDLSTGKEKVLYSFCSQANCADGARPYAGLIDVKGTLYGTTFQGGANGYGTVFSLSP